MAEAVSIALAVAALVVPVCEHYGKAAKCIRAFKAHKTAVRTYEITLQTQQTIFLNANVRLLRCCTNEEKARQMLKSTSHPGWQEEEFAKQYSALMSDARGLLKETMRLICSELEAIRKSLSAPETPGGSQFSGWTKRLKFALHEPSVKKSLAVLREHTQDFNSLVDICMPSQPRAKRSPETLYVRNQLKKFGLVRDKASDLHGMLRHACTEYREHEVLLDLELDCSFVVKTTIQFKLAFNRLSSDSTGKGAQSSDTNWLKAESIDTGRSLSPTPGGIAHEVCLSFDRVRGCKETTKETPSRTFLASQMEGPSQTQELDSLVLPGPALIRNRLLFSLGIMFLELAYRCPFEKLIRQHERDSHSPENAEFCAADRLSRGVSARMGGPYAEITWKLIHTDFGNGFSMAETRLQEAFYQDVICEL